MWYFTHVYAVLELAIQRVDMEAVEFLSSHRVFKETFEVLRGAEQLKALHLLVEKPISYYEEEQKSEERKDKRKKIAEKLIKTLAEQPFCPQYIFLLIALEEDIKKATSPDFYHRVFKQAYANITDTDIDKLIKTKAEDVKEITSVQFKS